MTEHKKRCASNKSCLTFLFGRLAVFLMVFTVLFSFTACKPASPIGDVVYDVLDTPIMALLFETGMDDGVESGGVIYRKVNDIDRLLAQEKVPVLMVFMNGRALSNAAIAFTEELCDKFSDSARIVRVNVGLNRNTEEIDRLTTLFGVSDFPWFATAYKGQKKSAISGFSSDIEGDIIRMIQDAAK